MGKTDTSWKTGQSGNLRGRPPKETSLTELMREHLEHRDQNGVSNKETFIRRVFDIAIKKADVAMIKLIWSYMDGQPKQHVSVNSSHADILETKRWIDEAIQTSGTA